MMRHDDEGIFEAGEFYTLVDDRPMLTIEKTETIKVKEVDANG